MAEAQRHGAAAALLPADVIEIKRARKTKTLHTARHLADRFGVHPAAIHAVWRGRTWRPAPRSSKELAA
jgi:hypothetical protein